MSKRLKILLDIDDTALLYNKKKKIWEKHSRLLELIELHNVYLFSGNRERIEELYIEWKTRGFYHKGSPIIRRGDILIDNNADMHLEEVEVRDYFFSIDEFFNGKRKKKMKKINVE